MTIAALLKWVDERPEVDRLTGEVVSDPRTSGPSDADLAALEWALRLSDARGNEPVVAVTVGPAAADEMLRDSVAAGAARCVRVDLPIESPSALVASAIADVVRDASLSFVVCGTYSIDRGSGSVPAFLAAHLDAAQALGCVTLSLDDDGAGTVTAERRLDGGRRELVRTSGPCVLSVEGGSARLRRAPLHAVVASRDLDVEVVRPGTHPPTGGAARRSPFRPRARVLPPPPADLSARERILALTGALVEREPPQLLVLEPDAAADRILEQLRAWGYVE
jgi:electron transfer flavoprotein beta subunit